MFKPSDLDAILSNKQSRIKSIDIISNDGMGSMGVNKNIDYLGFVKQSTTNRFLNLVPARRYSENITDIVRLIKEGNKIAPPTLFVDWIDELSLWAITGHEGRGRCIAIEQLYDEDFFYNYRKDIFVHIVPCGLRHRDMDEIKLNADFIHEDYSKKFEYPEHKYLIPGYTYSL